MKVIVSKIFTVIGLLVGLFGGIITVPVSAAEMPLVTGLSATSATSNSVSLRFNVNTNGVWTKYHIKYGENGSLTHQTLPFSIGDASGVKTETVSGLSAGKSYTFVAVVTDGTNYNNSNSIAYSTLGGGNNDTTDTVSSAVTRSASGVSENSASLNGYIDTKGRTVYYKFYYWTSNGSEMSTSEKTITSSQDVSDYISGLSAGTSYTYRLYTRNDLNQTNNGGQISFTTNSNGNNNFSNAPTVSLRTVSNLGNNSATVNFDIDPQGSLTSYRVDYGTSYSYDQTIGSYTIGSSYGSIPTQMSLSGLSAGSTYYYVVVAVNNNGTTERSGTFVTNNYGTGNQNQVTFSNPSVTDRGTNTVSIEGRIYTNRNYIESAWFEYDYSGNYFSRSAGYRYINGYSDRSENFYVDSLSPNASYVGRIVVRSNGQTFYSNNISFSTNGGNNYSSNSPEVETKEPSSVLYNFALLKGTVNTKASATTVWFEYGSSESNLSSNTSESNVGWENTFKDFYQISGSLKANTTYYYRAMAKNAYGTSAGQVRSFKTLSWISAPPAPIVIEETIKTTTESVGVILDRFVSTDKVDAGREFNYSLTYRNTTKGVLKDSALKIVLPEDLEFVNSSVRSDSVSSGVIVYRLGNIPGNSQSAISIVLRVKDDVIKGSVIPLNATLEWTDSSKNFQSTGAFTSVTVDKGATDSNGFFGSLSAFAGGFGWWLILLLLVLVLISMIYLIATRRRRDAHHQV